MGQVAPLPVQDGHAHRGPPDDLAHLLPLLLEGFLGALALGDVPGHRLEAQHVFSFQEQLHVLSDPDFPSVPGQGHEFVIGAEGAFLELLDQPPLHRPAVVFPDQLQEVGAHQLGGGVAQEAAGGGVGVALERCANTL